MQTQEQYYQDSNNHGQYQYVSLKDIVDNMLLEASEEDSYLKNVKRSKIINHARQAIRTVTRQVSTKILCVEVTVPSTLFWVLPQDYVHYKRISVVVLDQSTNSLRLKALNINENISTATGYLQDNNADLLFDSNGDILTADSSNGYNLPYKTYSFSTSFRPNQDASKLSKYGVDPTKSEDIEKAKKLGVELAMIDKRRPAPNVAIAMNIVGDVKNKNVVIIDDMIDTAGTLIESVKAIKQAGARTIHACSTHPVFSDPAYDRISSCHELDGVIVTDTIPLSEKFAKLKKVKVLSTADILAKAIHRTFNNDSVSSLFI